MKESKLVAFRLRKTDEEQLRKIAAQYGTTLTQIIRKAVEILIQKESTLKQAG